MQRVYPTLSDYIAQIAVRTSDALAWPSFRLVLARERSNDLRFTAFEHNSINITHSGTSRHMTEMDGIRDDRPTQPGDAILMPAGLDGRFAWTTHDTLERSVILQMQGNLFERYCPEVITPAFLRGHLRPRNYAPCLELVALTNMLVGEIDPASRRGQMYSDCVIRLLALTIAHSYWTNTVVIPATGTTTNIRLRGAIDLIETRFGDNLSLFDLTQATGLSPSYLIALFKSAMGTTPYAYLLDRRIKAAMALLRSTSRPLAEIALDCGFADQSHMTRMFQRRKCGTPRSYRHSKSGAADLREAS